MADTNASLDFTISYVNNTKVLLNNNPKIFSEQPDMSGFVPKKDGAFVNLKGIHNIMGHLQVAEKMIAGKGNNLIETFGEDVQENTYTMKIAGIAARLDAQIDDEAERTGKRPERLGWAYARKDGKDDYVTLYEIGETDERIRNSEAEEMPVEEKADTVMSVQRFNGEMDVAGGRTHFRHVHWINGESVEARAEKQVILNRPILSLARPIRKGYGKIVIGFDEKGKISARSQDASRRIKRNVKMNSDFETIKAVLTSEPMLVKVIAEKVGMTGLKVSKILKNAISAGIEIKMVVVKDENRLKRPAFYL